MRRAPALIAFVAVLVLGVSACGGGETAAGPQGGGGGQFDRSATLRMAWTLGPHTFDPHTGLDPRLAFPYQSLVYDRLTQVVLTPEGLEVAPMAATSWEFSQNGTVLTFQLREDVTFHDGTSLTAEAVRLSLERALTLKGSTVADDLAAIDRVEVVDKYTVRLHLNKPAADLPVILAMPAGSIINPKAIRNNTDLTQDPAGSGPYMLVDVRPGDRAIYERVNNYWDPKAGKAARIELIGISNETARLNALSSGQIDVALTHIPSYDQAAQIAESDQYGLASTKLRSWYAMFLNTARPPLDKVKVRRALNFAINRKAIADTVLNGQCRPTSQPLQEGVTGHAPSVEGAYSYNPDKARRLLTQAGVGDGFSMKVVVTSGPYARLAAILQDQLGQVGINVEIRKLEPARINQVWESGRADGQVQLHSTVAMSLITLQKAYLSPNHAGPLPEGYKQLVRQAFDSTLDERKRTQVLQQASRTASRQALDLFICAVPSQFVFDANVVGFVEQSAAPFIGVFDLRYVGVTAE